MEGAGPDEGEGAAIEARPVRPVTVIRKVAQLTVCVGCCCGRVDRGHREVPVDALKAAWKKYGLKKHVHLAISGCLGPCDVNNVALLMSEGQQTWLGELREPEHFDWLVDWARGVAEHGPDADLPEQLEPHRFQRWGIESL